ncbi:MAG: hypothetical protein CL694_07845 [Chloroflexi bacterium]|nr:hypothetical protein [Chloroflexota bacterium]HAL46408.1 hypothetical protein [Dehalococcoidia bacterium]|tara:strand:- start:2419 stop:3231 length:813 start_codon:yes stop_codon:yes gene_type:complete
MDREEIDTGRICPDCGASITVEANYCTRCGAGVAGEVIRSAGGAFDDRLGSSRARALRAGPFIVAVLAFFLPWMTLSSCNQMTAPAGPDQTPEIYGAPVTQSQSSTTSGATPQTEAPQGLVFVWIDEIRGVSGFDLAVGAHQVDSDANEYNLDPEPIAIGVLAIVLAGAVLFLVSGRARPVVGLVPAGVAFSLLFPLLVYPWMNLLSSLSYVGRIHFEWGYWLLCGSLLAAVAIHGTEMRLFPHRWVLIPVLGIPAFVWVVFAAVGEGVE